MAGSRTDSTTALPSGVVALYEVEYRPMVRLASLIVGSSDVAEEVVQDAFLAVANRWESVARPGGYLRTCVVNGARMHLRRQARELRSQELPEPAQLEADELWDVLAGLPERQRIALVLTYYGGWRRRDVAEALQCPTGTVKSLVHRGLRTLRKELER